MQKASSSILKSIFLRLLRSSSLSLFAILFGVGSRWIENKKRSNCQIFVSHTRSRHFCRIFGKRKCQTKTKLQPWPGSFLFCSRNPTEQLHYWPKTPPKKSEKGVELIALSQFWDFFWVVKTRQVPVAHLGEIKATFHIFRSFIFPAMRYGDFFMYIFLNIWTNTLRNNSCEWSIWC